MVLKKRPISLFLLPNTPDYQFLGKSNNFLCYRTSPIQYIKKIRLAKARDLIQEEGSRVNEAARRVGYESVTQFRREFKRYFGGSPKSFLTENKGKNYKYFINTQYCAVRFFVVIIIAHL